MKTRSFNNVIIYLIFIYLVITLFSCKYQNKADVILSIKHGSSFGECRGYCYWESIIDSNRIIKYRESSNKTEPIKRDTFMITQSEWESLKTSFKIASFFDLKETIGCPDCADGGAEWIEIECTNKKHKVTFEYGSNIKTIQDLLSLLRQHKWVQEL